MSIYADNTIVITGGIKYAGETQLLQFPKIREHLVKTILLTKPPYCSTIKLDTLINSH